jgi:hypothetical protein
MILLWPHSRAVLWAGILGFGFFMATVFPLVILWVERRMTLTGQVTSWFFVGSSLGSMTIPLLIGQMFESHGPQITMMIILIALLIAAVVFVLLMALGGPPLEQDAHDPTVAHDPTMG